jgi:transcriptional regulator with XRE-family HTH domain
MKRPTNYERYGISREVLGNRLSTLRKKAGLTLTELSPLVGVSASCLGDAENGRVCPFKGNLFRIAEFYQVSMLDLTGSRFLKGPGVPRQRKGYGDKVRESREESGFDRHEFSEALGISATTLGRIEQECPTVTPATLTYVLKSLNIQENVPAEKPASKEIEDPLQPNLQWVAVNAEPPIPSLDITPVKDSHTGYMICVEGGSSPTRLHETLESAEAEAIRLAENNHGKLVRIVQPVKAFKTKAVTEVVEV